jgi:hypothetical protein
LHSIGFLPLYIASQFHWAHWEAACVFRMQSMTRMQPAQWPLCHRHKGCWCMRLHWPSLQWSSMESSHVAPIGYMTCPGCWFPTYIWIFLTNCLRLTIIRGKSSIFFVIKLILVFNLILISFFSYYSTIIRRVIIWLKSRIDRLKIWAFSSSSRGKKIVSLENIFEESNAFNAVEIRIKLKIW